MARNFLNGKFLTSRWFIAFGILSFAIYLFSLVVLKKQQGLHLEEINQLLEIKTEVSSKKSELNKVLSKINFKPVEKDEEKDFDGDNIPSLEFPDAAYLDDSEYTMFAWIRYKTWFDLTQANLSPSELENLYSGDNVLEFLKSDLVSSEQKSLLISQLRYYLYSGLVHRSKERESLLLELQALVGSISQFYPKEAIKILEDIVNLSQELIQTKYLKPNPQFIKPEELRLFKMFQFLFQLNPITNMEEVPDYDWFEDSSLRCAYYFDYYRLNEFLMPLGKKVGDSDSSSSEAYFEAIHDLAEDCGRDLQFSKLEPWLDKLRQDAKLPEPAGPWDLGTRYKNHNRILENLRVDLLRRLKEQN